MIDTMQFDRLPPNNVKAEAALIACILAEKIYESESLDDAVTILPSPEMFYRGDHQIIWGEILKLYHAGDHVNFVTVGDVMDARKLDFNSMIDGPIEDFAIAHGMFEGVVYLAAIVRETADLRNAIEAMNDGLRLAYLRQSPAGEIIATAIDKLKGIEAASELGSETAASLLPGVLNRITERGEGKSFGIRTGLSDLDYKTDGFQPGEFAILAARPSMGKTALALNIADHVAINLVKPVLIISLEMTNSLLVERMLSARSGVDSQRMRKGTIDFQESADLNEAYVQIAEAAPIHMIKRQGRSIGEITADIRRMKIKHDISLAIVDYIQLMGSGNPRESEVQSITRISQGLKSVASDLSIPVLALSQLNRVLEGREDKRPRMAELRGSGSLEQDADLIALLYRPEQYDPNDQPGIAELELAKNRNGPTGMFRLTFEKTLMKFSSYSNADDTTYGADHAPF